MSGIQILSFQLYFSYGHFSIYDLDHQIYCDWLPVHVKQGFARQDHGIAVSTLLEYGTANITMEFFKSYSKYDLYQRAISVPIKIESGCLAIDSTDDLDLFKAFLPPNMYEIIIAQSITGNENQDILIQVLPSNATVSRLLVVDKMLDPSFPLEETADNIQIINSYEDD